MERHGFIHDMLDVKVLLLYLMSRVNEPVDVQKIYELAYQDDCLSYFDVAEALPQMVETGHLEKQEDEHYVITDKGRETVEITHDGGIVSVYANLDSGNVAVKEGDEVNSGALIGYVGDTSLSELADESHLHFGIKVNGVNVNPLDYISEDSKKASLSITEV